MSQVIVFENEDGGASILIPIPDCGLSIEEVAAKDVPDGKEYLIIDDSELPDRQYRNQWRISNGAVIVDNTIINETPKPIREIDARRLRLALLELGLLDTVELALSNLPKAAQIDWEYATIIREDYPLVVSLSGALGLNVTQVFDKAQSIGSV
jgi:hypothetical protein